ncbi:unnamed protein product [Microthlaspi erraticum]|uniref:Zinc finger GRF-type domain-containing protein n=1 Tax=Microthlaspi erraticum TaxID=1685480 RepID=A0A6D2HF36_9BRAS|nr:unnamed protein product [Microthlaspi erraticum]
MGPHSWVATSSSSSYSLDENTIRDGEYGMPSYCYCGGRVIRETSRTEQDPGKLYFSCEFRAKPGYHIRKWWDRVIEEELEILHSDIKRVSGEIESLQTHHRAGMEELISELKDGELTFIIMDMRIAEKRISDLKEEHEQSKAEITRLELVIGDFNKKYKAVESTFAIAAVLLLLAWFLVWFK